MRYCHTRRDAAFKLSCEVQVLMRLSAKPPDPEAEKKVVQEIYGALEDYESASYREARRYRRPKPI